MQNTDRNYDPFINNHRNETRKNEAMKWNQLISTEMYHDRIVAIAPRIFIIQFSICCSSQFKLEFYGKTNTLINGRCYEIIFPPVYTPARCAWFAINY